jgi:hypothetical protein
MQIFTLNMDRYNMEALAIPALLHLPGKKAEPPLRTCKVTEVAAHKWPLTASVQWSCVHAFLLYKEETAQDSAMSLALASSSSTTASTTEPPDTPLHQKPCD